MICMNKCHNCPNIIYINNPTINNNALELSIPNTNIQNNDKLCFVITDNIPTSENPLPVKILVNGIQFSYISKYGNYIYSDQLLSRKLYVGIFKTDSLLLLNSKCNLCTTKTQISNITIPTPTNSNLKIKDKNDK